MKCNMSLNIKVISQYQFVCTRLSSAHTPTRKLVGVWALDKLVHTNRYCEIYIYYKLFHNIGLYARVCQELIHPRVYEWMYARLTNECRQTDIVR